MKEGNDKLTISVDENIKNLYKEFCDKRGLKIGKQLELFMLSELKKNGVDLKEDPKGNERDKHK